MISNDLFGLNSSKKQIDNVKRIFNNGLRNIFGKEIKGNFLVKILYKVLESFKQGEINKYYPYSYSIENEIAGDSDTFAFDICKHIIGCHQSNMIFVDNDKQKEYRESSEYEKKLVNQVIENVKLRLYGSSLFRQKQIIEGDRFLYFNLPYDLFVICVRANIVLTNCNAKEIPYYAFFSKIINMSLSTLSLLENNYIDNAYPICRGIIELFLIYLAISSNEDALEKYNYLMRVETNNSQCGLPYPSEFFDLYNNRLNQKENKKTAFLNFGWVDDIKDYHKIVKKKPYTIDGIIQYLNEKYPELESYNYSAWYKKCNHYTHASLITTYPLLGYFEISTMLYITIPLVYEKICEYARTDLKIDNIDIINKLRRDFESFFEQYNERNGNIEIFKEYYQNKIK